MVYMRDASGKSEVAGLPQGCQTRFSAKCMLPMVSHLPGQCEFSKRCTAANAPNY